MSRGIIGVWLLLILWFSLILCFYSFRQKIYQRLILSVPVVAASYYMLQLYGGNYGARPSDLTAVSVCALCSALIIFGVLQAYHWQQIHLSEMSVKYAVDALPIGICCYEENGRVLLKNKTMEFLYRKITGKALLNGASFEKLLFVSENTKVNTEIRFLKTGEMIVVIFPDQRVFEFQRELLGNPSSDSIKDREYVLTASEITEEYQKTQTLLRKQKTVTELNEQLKAYNLEILSTITAREVLNAKVKIHDELGATLLRIKKYLGQNPAGSDNVSRNGAEKTDSDRSFSHPPEQQEIMESLRKSVTFLQHELNPIEKDEYILLLKTANDLDVRVEIEGKLPEEKKLREIYVTAFHECLTNTLRHARGNCLKVTFLENPEQIQGIYTNNGIAPSGKIVEKGGLKSLRNLVEQEGGAMEIQVKEGFWLTITFPVQ